MRLEFDGQPAKIMQGRVLPEQRPKTGEIWCNCVDFVVIITTVDPYGRWYNYERVDENDGELRFGRIGQTDVMQGTAYRLDEE